MNLPRLRWMLAFVLIIAAVASLMGVMAPLSVQAADDDALTPEFWKPPEGDAGEPIERPTHIRHHLYVLIGGAIVLAGLGVLFVVLYFRAGLPAFAFIGRVIIPALFLGAVSMCVFAFIGWLFGRRLMITQISGMVGAVVGVIVGLRYIWRLDNEYGPIRFRDYF